MTRSKRDFRTIRKRSNGRWQASSGQATSGRPGSAGARRRASPRRRPGLEGRRRPVEPLVGADVVRRAKVRRATEAFGPYAESWLEHREIKPRTRAHYRRLLDRFLLPSLGEMALRDITPSVVRVWHSELDPSHPTQRAHAYSLLRTHPDDSRGRRDPRHPPVPHPREQGSPTGPGASSRRAWPSWTSCWPRCPTATAASCCWPRGVA